MSRQIDVTEAWRACCRLQQCRYILWTADGMDTLIRTYAPKSVVALYEDVRFLVQRVDIGRFYALFAYGGLYADLDVLPNHEVYGQCTLGLCKMAARALSQQPEWEIETVVATRGNKSLLRILEHMITATQEKKQWIGIS